MEGSEALEVRLNEDSSVTEDLIKQLQDILNNVNPYASAYRHMYDVEMEEHLKVERVGVDPNSVTMIFREEGDKRCYNAPLDEVAAVFIGEDGAPPGNHDIVVYPKNQSLRHISYLNQHCDLMMYPILFPTGQFRWDPTQLHNDGFRTSTRIKITQLQYYSYRLAVPYTGLVNFYINI